MELVVCRMSQLVGLSLASSYCHLTCLLVTYNSYKGNLTLKIDQIGVQPFWQEWHWL